MPDSRVAMTWPRSAIAGALDGLVEVIQIGGCGSW